MNCKEYQELIPAFIKKEIEGEKRIIVKSHLKFCGNCREQFLSQIKFFYTLDREDILMPDPDVSSRFKQELLDRIKHPDYDKKPIKKKWIWYAAAAILLIGILIGRFVIPHYLESEYLSTTKNSTLIQLIDSEDWNRLEIVLSDQKEFSRYADETIPIQVLLDKLESLQKKGIQSLPVASLQKEIWAEKISETENHPQIQISLSDFIRILEHAKQQRSQITLEDVSKLITKL